MMLLSLHVQQSHAISVLDLQCLVKFIIYKLRQLFYSRPSTYRASRIAWFIESRFTLVLKVENLENENGTR